MRVKVYDGSGENFLGFGNLVGKADVYLINMPDGSIKSLDNAEECPSEEFIKETEGELEKVSNNPKIILDNGKVVYGCQVWWGPVPDKSN